MLPFSFATFPKMAHLLPHSQRWLTFCHIPKDGSPFATFPKMAHLLPHSPRWLTFCHIPKDGSPFATFPKMAHLLPHSPRWLTFCPILKDGSPFVCREVGNIQSLHDTSDLRLCGEQFVYRVMGTSVLVSMSIEGQRPHSMLCK
jgi:hypothetical protein